MPRVEWARMRRIIELGLPAALQTTLEVGVFAAATALAGQLDAPSLAAHQIALQVSALTFVVTLGIGVAGGVLVGHALGADQPDEARRRGWIAILMGLGFMACASLMLLVARNGIVSTFTPDPEVLETGATLLLIVAAFQLPDGLQAVTTGNLRGLGDTRTPMFSNLAGYWLLGLPLGHVLCFELGLGVIGLWLGLSAGLVTISAILLTTWMVRTRRFRSS